MAATNQNVKSFFALIGKNVTNQHLLKVRAALATQRYGTDEDGNPRVPTADDFVDWLYRHARAFVNRHTENAAKAEVVILEEDLLQ